MRKCTEYSYRVVARTVREFRGQCSIYIAYSIWLPAARKQRKIGSRGCEDAVAETLRMFSHDFSVLGILLCVKLPAGHPARAALTLRTKNGNDERVEAATIQAALARLLWCLAGSTERYPTNPKP